MNYETFTKKRLVNERNLIENLLATAQPAERVEPLKRDLAIVTELLARRAN